MPKQQFIEKFVWNSDNEKMFTDLMCTDETCTMLDRAIHFIDIDINEALSIFNNCIKQKAECRKRQIKKNKSKTLDEWFDHECKLGRRNVRKLLKKLWRSLHVDDRNVFCKASR